MGVFLTQSGLDWLWATAFAALIYAGSFEFLLVGLVTTLAPPAATALTAFLVNVRHIFYASAPPLHGIRSHAGTRPAPGSADVFSGCSCSCILRRNRALLSIFADTTIHVALTSTVLAH